MANKPPESVIARLMGLDEPPPYGQTSDKKHTVVSGSCISKFSPVGIQYGNPVSIRRSCSNSTYGESLHGVKALAGVQMLKNKSDIALMKRSDSTAIQLGMGSENNGSHSVPALLSGASYEGRKAHSESGRYCTPRHIVRSLQRPAFDSLAGNLQFENAAKRGKYSGSSVFEPNSVKAACNIKNFKMDVHSKPLSRKPGELSRPESLKLHHDYKNPAVNLIPSPKFSRIAHKPPLNRVSQQLKHRIDSKDVSGPRYKNEYYLENKPEVWEPSSPCVHVYKDYYRSPRVFPIKSPLASKSGNINFEKWKMSKKVQDTKIFERGQTLDESHVLAANRNLKSRKLNPGFRKNSWNLEQYLSTWRNYWKKQKNSQEDMLEPTAGRGLEQLQSSPGLNDSLSQSFKVSDSPEICFSCSGSDYSKPDSYTKGNPVEMVDMCIDTELDEIVSASSNNYHASQYAVDDKLGNETSNIVFSGLCVEQQEEASPSTLSKEDVHFYRLEEFFCRQALNEFSKKDSAYLNCSRLTPRNFQEYLKGSNQRSLDSVMEPFDSLKPSVSKCFESMGLISQLDDLDFESEATCSEGSVMAVSGDEDSAEGSGNISHHERKIQRWSGDYESRNFSYLVDVLDEAGLCSVKSFMDLKKGDTLECPISHFVFESLEKKYGKQTSWPKSERRLLFDRINSGLMDTISNPVNGSETSIRRWFSTAWRRGTVEDVVWVMLMSEEDENSKNLSEKALGRTKWLDLEEDTGIVCRELETYLFEELVMELASL